MNKTGGTHELSFTFNWTGDDNSLNSKKSKGYMECPDILKQKRKSDLGQTIVTNNHLLNTLDKNYQLFFLTLIEKYILATFKLKPFKN